MDVARVAYFVPTKKFSGGNFFSTTTGQVVREAKYRRPGCQHAYTVADLPGYRYVTSAGAAVIKGKENTIFITVWKSRSKAHLNKYAVKFLDPSIHSYLTPVETPTTIFFDTLEGVATYLRLKGI